MLVVRSTTITPSEIDKLSSLRLGSARVVEYLRWMTTPRDPLYAGYRYPAELISYAVWLYFRFRQAGNHAGRRASPAQGPEQPGGEFPPTDLTTRADHEALQIAAAGATVSFHS
jgi:hypothetical protein